MKTFSGYLGYRTSNHDFWKEFVWFIQRDFFLKLLQHGKGKKNPLKSICFHSNMWLYMISSASTDLGSPRELLGQKNSASTPGPELNEQQALMILAGSEWLTTLGCGEDQWRIQRLFWIVPRRSSQTSVSAVVKSWRQCRTWGSESSSSSGQRDLQEWQRQTVQCLQWNSENLWLQLPSGYLASCELGNHH